MCSIEYDPKQGQGEMRRDSASLGPTTQTQSDSQSVLSAPLTTPFHFNIQQPDDSISDTGNISIISDSNGSPRTGGGGSDVDVISQRSLGVASFSEKRSTTHLSPSYGLRFVLFEQENMKPHLWFKMGPCVPLMR